MSIKRHTAYNFFGSIVALIVLVISIPWYLKVIGMERYGVLSILWLVFGYFGFFDFGIGRALAHKIAGVGQGSIARKSDYFWSGFILNLLLSLIGSILLFFVLKVVLSEWLTIDPGLHDEVSGSVLWVSLSLIPAILCGTFQGLMLGSKKFLSLNIVEVSGKVLLQMLPLVAAILVSPNLVILTQAILIARMLTLCLWVVASRHILPVGVYPWLSSKIIRSLWGYGSWVTVGLLLAPFLSGIERIFIGHMQGAAFVTLYAIPFSIVAPVALLSASLSNALFPRFAEGDKDVSGRLVDKAVLIVTLVVTPVMVLLAFIVQPFLSIWIDDSFSQKTLGVAQLLVVGFWANSLAKVFHTKLQGIGKPKVVTKVHFTELIPFLLVLYFMTSNWGVLGASFTWTVRTVVDMLLLGRKSNSWGYAPPPFVFVSFSFVAVSSLFSSILYPNIFNLFMAGFLLIIISSYWSWYMGLKEYLYPFFIGLLKVK